MNTLTIAVLLVCATMAYASVVPGEAPNHPAVAEADIFDAQETRYEAGYGGGHGHHHGGGGHHHGGGGHHYG